MTTFERSLLQSLLKGAVSFSPRRNATHCVRNTQSKDVIAWRFIVCGSQRRPNATSLLMHEHRSL